MVTSLVDLFLVRRSGSRWKIDRQAVSCRAIWSIMLASFFSVGENSTCSLDKGKKKISKSQNPLDITQKAIFYMYWLFTMNTTLQHHLRNLVKGCINGTISKNT